MKTKLYYGLVQNATAHRIICYEAPTDPSIGMDYRYGIRLCTSTCTYVHIALLYMYVHLHT